MPPLDPVRSENLVPQSPKSAAWLVFVIPLLIITEGAILVVLFSVLSQAGSPENYYASLGGAMIVVALLSTFVVKKAILPYTKFGTLAQNAVSQAVTAGARYELALRGASEGFWDYNIPTGDIFFSAHLMAMLGFPERDHTDKIEFWHTRIHPSDIEGVKRTLEYHLDKRTPDYGVEYRIHRDNGEYIWVEDRGRASWNSEGKPDRIAGVTKDISNIKRVQTVLESRTNELEEAKVKIEEEIRNVKKFRMAVDASTEAVSITTPEANIIYVNPAWTLLNGWSEAEALGKNPNILKSEATPPEVFAHMWEKLDAGSSFINEDMFNKRKDGSKYQAALAVYPLREGEQTIFYVSIAQDITQRKDVDRAKTEFVSLASHQLRTPLSAIRWYSEMLLSKYAGILNDKQRQYVEEIYHGNLRMVDLVNALLNTSRIDLGTFAIEPEKTNPVEIANSVLKELAPQIIAKRQAVRMYFDAAPPMYIADAKLLRIIFQNFLSNSVKYTQEEGQIEVEISAKAPDLYIRVTDNGYGIPKSQHNKIFEKLFRADNVRQKDTEGTGLGMYIVKAIVEVSGGKIWFDSEENKGTTFNVLLPLAGMPKKTGTRGLS
jgi:two-component system cell cycle sensor histidine kinase PleC